ncbi:unnamed protein product [Rotaria magnacalcarata]|uniref:Uncharacterized protein n=1 Tax=Rotaria magnacalcarata TaxID=392030 RepID=A0A814S2G0_9BILA|nr:unnamed protein product [Rotaria magnacalcarata]CAF4125013.1 unnamed protein product [Rotaria magnacalcarata]
MVFVYSLPDSILDRFGSHILSKIYQNIKWLDLESLGLVTETCAYDELILLLLHRMLSLEKLHLCLTVGEKEHYHIYSYPYKLNYYDDITNNLPGGILKYVCKVSLFNEHPFEHEFFLRIAQSFSMMENLTVRNEKRQINKRYRNFRFINH